MGAGSTLPLRRSKLEQSSRARRPPLDKVAFLFSGKFVFTRCVFLPHLLATPRPLLEPLLHSQNVAPGPAASTPIAATQKGY